jgi:hypothetical protein
MKNIEKSETRGYRLGFNIHGRQNDSRDPKLSVLWFFHLVILSHQNRKVSRWHSCVMLPLAPGVPGYRLLPGSRKQHWHFRGTRNMSNRKGQMGIFRSFNKISTRYIRRVYNLRNHPLGVRTVSRQVASHFVPTQNYRSLSLRDSSWTPVAVPGVKLIRSFMNAVFVGE